MAPANRPDDRAFVPPMLASLVDAPLVSATMVYEPKYDGIRAIAAVSPGRSASVRVWSRLGRDKTAQFPEVTEALRNWARTLAHPVVLDGEIVAVDANGMPLGFQHLQPRINRGHAHATASGSALIAFDVLRVGDDDLRSRPLHERRARLEQLFATPAGPRLRMSEQAVGDGRALHARAVADGLEGLVAKRRDSRYLSGKRSPDWRKLKLDRRTSVVVGGWTEPRGSRVHLGSLILGQFDAHGALVHVGQVGTGFDGAELERLATRLSTLRTKTCPFSKPPTTETRAHWVAPTLVAEVRFTEWTSEGRLRHPTYLGLRDDVPARTATREAEPSRALVAQTVSKVAVLALVESLMRLEHDSDGGTLTLPDGGALEVNHLRKVFWPELGLTKGDLLRHYARVAPALLPVLADRPLVMKRYPNGVAARPFYQHRAPDHVPRHVRIESVATNDGVRSHVVGGNLATLLYTAQLASISQDPWASRVGNEEVADYVAFDLDPPDEMPFARVLDVARWLRDELRTIGAVGFPKTSGAGGLHVYVRLPPRTPFQACLLYGQIVATIVAGKHPRVATVERSLSARGRRLYVDYMQNARGKTLASAYSVRANSWAGVSTPLTWEEVDGGVSPLDFTLPTFEARLRSAGDLWAGLAASAPADLLAVSRYGTS